MRAYPTYLLLRAVGAFAGACAFTLNLVYQIETVGLGPLELVLVGTALEVTCFLAQVPTGILADLYSRRLSVIVGYLLIGTGVMLEGLVPAFVAILAGNVLWGVGATCVDGAEEAWAADELGEDRVGASFTRGAQVAQVSAVVGIAAAVGLAGVALNLPVVAAATCWMVAGTESRTRATVFSLNGQLDAAGQTLGGPPVGLVGERVSIRAALVCTGLLAAPAVPLLALRRTRAGDADLSVPAESR